jgi:hypothetical protein
LIGVVVTSGDGAAFWLALAALVAVVLSVAVFFTVTDPANREIATWQPDAPRADRSRTRVRWEISHGVRGTLFLTAVGLLVAGLSASA